jgi:hypothetical protein
MASLEMKLRFLLIFFFICFVRSVPEMGYEVEKDANGKVSLALFLK